MKLFIWDHRSGALMDWNAGLVVVVANDLDDAHRAFKSACPYGDIAGRADEVIDLNGDQFIEPRAFFCWGSA